MGGKGGGSVSAPNMGSISIAPNPYEERLAAIANQLYTLTGPLRAYSLEDLGNFMRGPVGASPWMPGGVSTTGVPNPYSSYTGTTSTSGVGGTTSPSGGTNYTSAGAGTSTPLSTNFTTPNKEDITRNLQNVYKYNDVNAFNDSAKYLIQNYNEPVGGQLTGGAPLTMVNGQANPELDTWINNRADKLWQQSMERGMQQIANSQAAAPSTTATGTMGGGTGLTSSGMYNPYSLPAYAPLYQMARTGLESQYNPARENIMASTPRGGALYENLANLEMQRAQQAGALPASLAAPIIQDLYNKAYGVAWQTPQTSISGLTGAEQGIANRYGSLLGAQSSVNNAAMMASAQQSALNQQAQSSMAGGIGSLIGMGVKAATGGKA